MVYSWNPYVHPDWRVYSIHKLTTGERFSVWTTAESARFPSEAGNFVRSIETGHGAHTAPCSLSIGVLCRNVNQPG